MAPDINTMPVTHACSSHGFNIGETVHNNVEKLQAAHPAQRHWRSAPCSLCTPSAIHGTTIGNNSV
jgi:hypothetical protein